jgi:hypothetical protein
MLHFGIDPAHTGYRPTYRPLEANHCPGCGHSHWLIGRSTAECAYCATALPLMTGGSSGIGTLRQNTRHDPTTALAA